MSSGDKVDTPDSSKTVSPSSSGSCSHCGSLFVHHKGCRYCLPSKKQLNVPLKKRLNTGSTVKRESVKCLVPCCPNFANKNPKKDFFYPDVADDRKHLWLGAIGVSTLPSKISICEEHFDLEADCENYIKFKYYPTKWNRLKKTVVPTRFPCKTKKSTSGSYPEHDHVFDDHNIPTKVTKKRSFPDDQSHQSGSVAKKPKVVAQAKVENNEPGKATSPNDKFDFLNGDITNLIAHVQPSICSWDVSVVDVHSPGSSAGKGSGSSTSKTTPEERTMSEEGRRCEDDESESDSEDVPGMDQESSNDEDLETESTGIERNSSFKSNTEQARSELSEKEMPRATRSSKRISSSNKTNLENGGCDRDTVSAEEQVKLTSSGESVFKGVEEDLLHPTSNSAETTSSTSGLCREDFKTQSGSSTSVSAELIVVTTDEGPATTVANEKRSGVELELTCEVDEPSSPNHKMAASANSAVFTEAKPTSSTVVHPTVVSTSSTLQMDVDPSDDPQKSVDAEPAGSLVNTSNRRLTSGRVADPNCSCVLCGGTSDVDEDSSDDDDEDAVPQTPLRTDTPVASGSKHLGASTSKIGSGRTNVLSARTPSMPMTRIMKHIDETFDLSDYVSESDTPETIASDSDSEWTPSDQERKLEPIRTTRSSMKAKDTEKTPYRSLRIIEKSEKTRVTSSSIKNGVQGSELKDSESKDGDEDVSENLSSLRVNMEETVASYKLNKTKTTYSYKRLYEGGDPDEGNTETSRSDKVLVVREREYDSEEFNHKGPLPQPMVDLLENMKTYFDHFFEKLDKLKKTAKSDSVPSSDDVTDESQESSTEKCIETLEEDVKMFPALLNLEMVQFVQKCKQHFQDRLDVLGQKYKRVRWCVACPDAALFHCCFKAAYCSCKCQRKHWDEHRKDCAQENVTLLDPHLRLNNSLMLRVKNLNKSKFTISDLEKSQPRPKPSVGESKEDQTSSSIADKKLVPVARKNLYTPKPTYTKTALVNSQFTPKMNGSATLKPFERRLDHSIAARRSSIKTSDKSPTVVNDPLKIVSPPNKTVSKTAATKKNETFFPSFAVKKSPTVTLSSRITSVAASAVSSGSILLPKTMNNGGITTTAGTNQVMVKFRSVTLPNGDKRLIPIDLPLDQSYSVVQTTSPSSGKQTSGSILITRPAKSAYTATTGFIPLTQVSPSSHPVILQQGVNGILTPISSPMVSQSAPPLPTLTPIPKQGPCSIRTLNDDELNKILNTDHLQSAFDDSYYANTRIRS